MHGKEPGFEIGSVPLRTLHFLSFFFFLFMPQGKEILVLGAGIKPVAPATEAHSPNHWTVREFPRPCTLIEVKKFQSTNIYSATPVF